MLTTEFLGRKVKLGRSGIKRDRRTLRFNKYAASLPPAPAAADWSAKMGRLTMMGNDNYGDCVFAGKGNNIRAWTANESSEVILPDSLIISAYLEYTGGRDNGAVLLEVLNLMRKQGIGGHKIWAYAAIDPHDHEAVKQAIHIFGGVDLACTVGSGWMNTTHWTRNNFGRADGGHCVAGLAYDDAGIRIPTWAEWVNVDWDAIDAWFDECYCMISPDWIAKDAISPSGFDLPMLHADLFILDPSAGMPS